MGRLDAWQRGRWPPRCANFAKRYLSRPTAKKASPRVANHPLNIQTRARAFYPPNEQPPCLARPFVRSPRSTVPEISAVAPGLRRGPVAAPPQPSGGRRRRRTTPQPENRIQKGSRGRSPGTRARAKFHRAHPRRRHTQLFTPLCAWKRAQNLVHSRAPATRETHKSNNNGPKTHSSTMEEREARKRARMERNRLQRGAAPAAAAGPHRVPAAAAGGRAAENDRLRRGRSGPARRSSRPNQRSPYSRLPAVESFATIDEPARRPARGATAPAPSPRPARPYQRCPCPTRTRPTTAVVGRARRARRRWSGIAVGDLGS